MKWLQSLFRKRDDDRDTRIYTVASPRVAKRYEPPPRNVPEPDPIFSDTGGLALTEESEEDVNPYNTSSWSLDPEQGIRRVEDDKTVTRDGREKSVANNPYDTGAFRRGW